MRIRGRKPLSSASAAADHSASISPSSSSSVSSSSSITAANSPLSSSQDSSSSYPFPLFATTTNHRCHGLDLLVKAIHQVNGGSVIGVPYIQRRVTIRRRRREIYIFAGLFEQNNRKGNEKNSINSKKKKVKKDSISTKKGPRGLPKSPDSVLKPWGRRSAVGDEMRLCL